MVSEEVSGYLRKLAALSPTREICGLLTRSGRVYPIANVARSNDAFVMQKKQYFAALKKIAEEGDELRAIYHSHPVNPAPSAKDLEYFQRSGVDMLIVTAADWRYLVWQET